MKIASQSLSNNTSGTVHPQGFVPPISFDKVERPTPSKGDATEFKLYTRPEDPTSQTYNIEVRHFSKGTPENWLETLEDINRVLKGSRITTADASFAIVRAILKGEALRLFESGATTHGIDNMDAFNNCLRHVTTHIFPPRALVRQKRYLQWYARKHHGISIRDYVVRLRELNEQLKSFPPFGVEAIQKLPDDELVEIIEHGIPKSWINDMTKQGFDPVEHTLQELSDFCERLETAEAMNPQSAINNAHNNRKRKRGARPKADADLHSENTATKGAKTSEEANKTNYKKSKTGKYCHYHRTTDHDFSECKVMIAQAERMRAAWQTKSPTVKNQQNKKKKDLHAILDEIVEEHVRKKMAACKINDKVDTESESENDDEQKSVRDENFTCDLDEFINQKVFDLYPLSTLRHPHSPTKSKIQVAPITVAHVNSRLNRPTIHKLRVLLDSGASATLISKSHVKRLLVIPTEKSCWDTRAGVLTTHGKCEIKFSLPEFFTNRIIEWPVHVDDCPNSHRYDMIIGRDLLEELGISLDFANHTMTWDNATIHMKDLSTLEKVINDSSFFFWHEEEFETDALQSATDRIKRILDAKYEKANLDEIVHECSYLTDDEQSKLLKLLKKHEYLFDGTLGRWDTRPYNIELKPDVIPYHARAFPIPKIHEPVLKMELDRLCSIGVLRKINESEWAAPTFIIPKKDGTVRFISDFRELNKRIKRKPYPIPHIQDLLRKLEGFMYATSLDLNMGYYHIVLTPFSRKLCTIVTPWGKYEYLRLPMGLCNSPDIFQERMHELMSGLDFVRAYIDDILVMTTSDWDDHLSKLDEVLTRLGSVGLKVNIRKSFFGRNATEYLGFWITRHGISPLPKKVEAILNIAPPTTKKELRCFIGLINYYRDMWIR